MGPEQMPGWTGQVDGFTTCCLQAAVLSAHVGRSWRWVRLKPRCFLESFLFGLFEAGMDCWVFRGRSFSGSEAASTVAAFHSVKLGCCVAASMRSTWASTDETGGL